MAQAKLIAVIILVALASFVQAELHTTSYLSDANLVSYWRLNGNAIDEKGVNNGTITGATYTTSGMFGGAYVFNGTTDYITIPSSLIESVSGEFTISAWVKTSATQFNPVVAGIVGASNENFFFLRPGSTSYIRINNTTSASINFSTSGYNDGEWHHLVLTYNSADKQLVGYYDGVLYQNVSADCGNYTLNNMPLRIGADPRDVSGHYFNGTIDDVAIFNRSLTAGEVEELYLAGTQQPDIIVVKRSGSTTRSSDSGGAAMVVFAVMGVGVGAYLTQKNEEKTQNNVEKGDE